MFRRAAHLIWGADVDEALRPVLLVSLMGSVAGSSSWIFMGIWAVKQLGATSGQLAFGYLVSAAVGGVVGYAGGHLSDLFGRRTLILAGDGLLAVYMLLFLFAGHDILLGLGLMVGAGALGSFGRSAGQAIVADLVPRERHEIGYASVRVASNLGVTLGPPIGSLFLLVGGWSVFFPGVSLLALGAWTVSFLYLPRRGAYAPTARPERGSLGVILADHAFLLFMAASVFSWLVYVGYETVLPVSLVESHGVPVWGWGALVVINPLLVTLFQLRLTRSVARFAIVPKWIAAMLLMGLPFLLLGVTSAIPVIVIVLVLFVIGEMLWVPPRHRSSPVSHRQICAGPTWAPSGDRRRPVSLSPRSSACRARRGRRCCYVGHVRRTLCRQRRTGGDCVLELRTQEGQGRHGLCRPGFSSRVWRARLATVQRRASAIGTVTERQ